MKGVSFTLSAIVFLSILILSKVQHPIIERQSDKLGQGEIILINNNINLTDIGSSIKSLMILFQSKKNTTARLGVNKLVTNDIDEKTASKITTIIYNKLKAIKGAKRVVYRVKDGISKSTNRQLIGRISKLGKSYVLSIKVVEGEKGKLLFNETVIIKGDDDIEESIDNVVKKISSEKSIW
ncbi:MAG: hypothetical protein SVR08_07890 [Spirochaetota bacterium]|nr:hypothetical protein [Spirochaetota bacterium]